MISKQARTFTRFQPLFAAAALVCAGFLAGCKGNTTSAALTERMIPKPPSVTALPAADSPLADPLTSPTWSTAHWLDFTAPVNTTRTTAPTHAAMVFDASNLYVAFVSEEESFAVAQDSVSVYLDTTRAGNGTELLKVTVNESGAAACTWIRAATPAMKRDDGSPDFAHPVSTFPDITVSGLTAKVSRGSHEGKAVWTTVVAVPLRNLPQPLRTVPTAGSHWKFNLLRNVLTGTPGEELQSNLSPVYVGLQELAPYRLAELTLGQ